MKDKAPWLNRYLVILIAFWTVVMAGSFLVNRQNALAGAQLAAEMQARAAYEKDVLYRRWNSATNVYGQVSPTLQPNPYLPPEGRELYLGELTLTRVNPAYMTRLVHGMGSDGSNVISHITGLEPVNPDNAPDEWELAALKELAASPERREVSGPAEIDGREFLRYMGPLYVEPGCTGCHTDYKVGELRGGISVSVLMRPLIQAGDKSLLRQGITHTALWLLGLGVFGAGSWSITRRTHERDQAAITVKNLSAELKIRIAEHSEDVQNKQQQLQAFMDNTEAAVYIKNNLHEFLMINKHLAEMIGKAPEKLIGKRDGDFLGPGTARRMESCELTVLSSGKGLEIELFDAPDSKFPPHSAHFFPIFSSGTNRLTGVGCMLMDISKQKKTEEALLEAKENAEKINQAKNDFLANMSHEIRTPLNGVLGMAELLLHSELTEDQSAMASTIRSGATGLLVVLNDVLDFSKIEAGKMQMEQIPFSLRDTVFSAVKSMAGAAQGKELELTVNVASSVPDSLKGDPQRLRQILLNLLSNAIKFTPRGEITVTARLLEKSAQFAKMRISVSDTGIGIPKEKQEKIFAAFEQADMSTTRQYGGTGLGLSISSKLAALMNSRLRVESQPGYGSTFWMDLTLPLAGNALLRKPVFYSAALKELNVLVLDDSPEELRVTMAHLAAWKISSTACQSVDEALRLLRMADLGNRKFDLIIASASFESGGGENIANRLATEQAGNRLPIILLSSGGQVPGSSAYSAILTRPVQPEELVQAISAAAGLWEILDMERLREDLGEQHSLQPSLRLRVLLVEDLEMNQLVASRMLRELGHEAVVAENGQIALDLLEKEHFDLVLMDIQMPVLDGETAMRLIRSKERGTARHIPIVAITANAMQQDREKYMEAGADAYIAKPIQLFKLVKILDELAKRELLTPKMPEAEAGADALASADDNAKTAQASEDSSTIKIRRLQTNGEALETPGQAEEKAPHLSMFEQEALESSFSGNDELMRQSMEIYLRDAPKLLSEIEEALDGGDNLRLSRKAHALKGLNSYYTRGLAYENALALELAGRNGFLPEGAQQMRELFSSLREQVELLCSEMKECTGILKH